MKLRIKSRGTILTVGLVVVAVLAGWFEPTSVVRGWLRGEAFYAGRPTSYWSRELARWEHSDSLFSLLLAVSNECSALTVTADVARAEPDGRADTAESIEVLESVETASAVRFALLSNYSTCSPRGDYLRIPGLADKALGRFGVTLDYGDPPALLFGDPAAEAVLRELLDDPDPAVRAHAQRGLDQIQSGKVE